VAGVIELVVEAVAESDRAELVVRQLALTITRNATAMRAQSIAELGLKSECVSKVTLIETLEHVPPDAADRVLSELNRILKPGGRLVVSVPTPLLPRPEKHYRHYEPRELSAVLEKYFTIERLSGHYRRSRLYGFFMAVGDNKLLSLRAGNKFLRWYFWKFLESAPPEKALRLIAFCRKKS